MLWPLPHAESYHYIHVWPRRGRCSLQMYMSLDAGSNFLKCAVKNFAPQNVSFLLKNDDFMFERRFLESYFITWMEVGWCDHLQYIRKMGIFTESDCDHSPSIQIWKQILAWRASLACLNDLLRRCRDEAIAITRAQYETICSTECTPIECRPLEHTH